MNATILPIKSASVKVMRSYDYCHFEVVLGSSTDHPNGMSSCEVDDLRKCAARLADKAVAQYKRAKDHALRRETYAYERGRIEQECREIESIAEQDRTERQKATLKAHQDEAYWCDLGYDYEDDFGGEQ